MIERKGYRVIRFANREVMQNLDGVLAQTSLSLRDKEEASDTGYGKGDAR